MPRRSIAAVLLGILVATAGLSARRNPRTLSTPGAQTFTRRVVAAGLANPREVTCGPDGHLHGITGNYEGSSRRRNCPLPSTGVDSRTGQVEKVGEELRAMMPWIAAGKSRPQDVSGG